MGTRILSETIYFKLAMPFPIKYNYISERLPKEKNRYDRNRKMECLCFLLQYESMKHSEKRQFEQIFVYDNAFYIPKISANCQVMSAKTIPYDYKWYSLNEEKYLLWQHTIGRLIEPYYELSVDDIQKLVFEKMETIKRSQKNNFFVNRRKKISIYHGFARLKNDTTFLGGVKMFGFIVTYYFMIPLLFLSVMCLIVFIIRPESENFVALVGTTAFLIVSIFLFLLQILLSYNKIFKESVFEKEYKKRFNIKK